MATTQPTPGVLDGGRKIVKDVIELCNEATYHHAIEDWETLYKNLVDLRVKLWVYEEYAMRHFGDKLSGH